MLISVVIPTCHRGDLLERCLSSLQPGAQGESFEDVEIVVTDDGCDEAARAMISARGFKARWVRGPGRGPAANRNHGAGQARGEWVAFIDDDCEADRGWLAAIRREALSGESDVAEGQTIIPDKVDHPFRQGVENLRGDLYWSCNLAIRRSVFEDLRGFDEDFTEACCEDVEFAFRLRKRSPGRLRFVPAARVFHPVRVLTWRAVIRRTKQYRWVSLLSLKTRSGPGLEASPVVVAFWRAAGIITSNLRRSWHVLRDSDRSQWKTEAFWRAWDWLTLPLTLPYQIIWEFRFRRELRERTGSGPR